MVPMFVEDMQFDGADSGAISWGDEVPDEAKAASPVVVIGCGHVRASSRGSVWRRPAFPS